jgi:hypothetical protein
MFHRSAYALRQQTLQAQTFPTIKRVNSIETRRRGPAILLANISLCLSAIALSGCDVEFPQEQKVADCTTNSFDFKMTIQYSGPYQFVLGVPLSRKGQLSFRGDMVLQQSTGVVARIPITSEDIRPCNWLASAPGLSGYILTWSHTNHGDRLSDLLVRGQAYDVHVALNEAPPVGSSLWLTSMKLSRL